VRSRELTASLDASLRKVDCQKRDNCLGFPHE
jgi:hypothetical protein